MLNVLAALGIGLALALPATGVRAQTPTPQPAPSLQVAPDQTMPTTPAAPMAPGSVVVPGTPGEPSVTIGGEPDSEGGRYTFYRADDGYLRLDGRLGHVSQCTRWQAGWVCRPVPDERGALETEIRRLQNENAALKREILGRNLSLPGQAKSEMAPPPAQPPTDAGPMNPAAPEDRTITLLTDEEFEEAVSFVERMWRGLVGMFSDAQRDVLEKS